MRCRKLTDYIAIMFISVAVMCLIPFHAYSNKPKKVAREKRAELVVDVSTGRVLYSYKSDHMRHPASLTKLMTLYLLFEQIDQGKLRPYSKIKISKKAARKPPSKLGLRAGRTITVRDAAYTLIIKSANDIAAAVGEKIAGSEEKFARLMTLTARKLGMRRTFFRNASGLPDRHQVTTARDMAILGIRIMQKFPHYYKYFSTLKKTVAGIPIRTHNHLLKSYRGMDGLKTGFINMSGFNLVSSAERNGNRLITVVMGGRTYRARDKKVAELTDIGWKRLRNPRGYRQFIGVSLPKLSALHTKFKPLESKKFKPRRKNNVITYAQGQPLNPVVNRDNAYANSLIDIKNKYANQVKESINGVSKKPNKQAPKTLKQQNNPRKHISKFFEKKNNNPTQKPILTMDPIAKLIDVFNQSPIQSASEKETPTKTQSLVQKVKQKPAQKRIQSEHLNKNKKELSLSQALEVVDQIESYKDWTIQVGAFSKKQYATKFLSTLRDQHKILSDSQPELVAIKKGKSYIYRARFSGFDKEKAHKICTSLKSKGQPCIKAQN